jgi:hypothetical protein
VARQPLAEHIGYDQEALHEHADRGRPPGIPPRRREHSFVLVAAARDPLTLAESRARHPSSARHDESHSEPTTRSACGSTPVTRAMRLHQGCAPVRKACRDAAAS